MKVNRESISILKKKIRILCEIAAEMKRNNFVDCPMIPEDDYTGEKCIHDCPRCFSEYANERLGVKVNW